MTEPLDPAAIMGSAAAVLHKFPGARVGELNLFADLYDLAVRQAADLAEANRKLAAVEALADEGENVMHGDYSVRTYELRAALGGAA